MISLNKLFSLYLSLRLHSNNMATFHHYLIHGLVQHVGSSVDCTQSTMTSEYKLLNHGVDLYFCIYNLSNHTAH